MNRLCLGTAQFGMNYGIANNTGKVDFNSIVKIIDFSLNNKINFFDTAQSYGNSEILLGNAFEELGVKSEKKIISKLSPDTLTKDIISSFNNSLKNLKTNSLWGLLLHRFNPEEDYTETFQQISMLKSQGKLKYFGVSIYDPKDAMYALKISDIDIIQVPFNILDRRLIDLDFFALSKKLKKYIFIRSIYLQGLLLMNEQQLIKKNMGWTIPYLSYLWTFSKKYNFDIKEFALQSILNISYNSKIITGVDSLTQLQENNIACNLDYSNSYLFDLWWKDLPIYPVKFLNPSLW